MTSLIVVLEEVSEADEVNVDIFRVLNDQFVSHRTGLRVGRAVTIVGVTELGVGVERSRCGWVWLMCRGKGKN